MFGRKILNLKEDLKYGESCDDVKNPKTINKV